jgi:transposase
MRSKGSAQELENRRKLAVRRIHEGYAPDDVAAFLGVHPRTLWRWLARDRDDPKHGLNAKPHRGRPPKLTFDQDLEVLSWFYYSPTSFGFPTDLWTAARVAHLIEQKLGVRFHPRYVSAWLAERGITPQKPRRQPRERDQEEIDRWLREDWARLEKKLSSKAPTSS